MLRCALALLGSRDALMHHRTDKSKSFSLNLQILPVFIVALEREMDQVYHPIASAPYLLFPGEKRPIKKLLEQSLPLKLDIEYEFEIPVAEGSGGVPVK